MPAGAITDDTEQAVLLGRLLVLGQRHGQPARAGRALVSWERDMAARGSLDLLGPSTKRAVAAVLAGVPPEEAGASGDHQRRRHAHRPRGIAVRRLGAALTPALVAPHSSLSTLVDQVVAASYVTHNTGLALAGAAAVAAAVSAGLAGLDRRGHDDRGTRRGGSPPAAGTGSRAPTSLPASNGRRSLVAGRDQDEAAELIYTLVGTSLATQESVPAAFAVLAAVPDDPWQACLLAASLGGDCDTIAAMRRGRRGVPRRRGLPARGARRHRRPRPGPGRTGR